MTNSRVQNGRTGGDQLHGRDTAQFSATTWWILGLNTASCFGSGLTKPFLIVYMHQDRSIDLATSGLLLASIGAAGLATMPIAGVMIDRIGPFKTFAIGQVIGGIGTAAYIPARDPMSVLVACLLVGISGGLTTNGLTTLIAVAVPQPLRGATYGLAYTSHNVGVGAGATVAGLVLAAGFASFSVIFLADAVSFLVFAVALLVLERIIAAPVDDNDSRERTGYRAVLADRRLLMVAGLGALITTAALSQTTAAIPAVAIGEMDLPTGALGVAFAANAVVLTACQPLVIKAATRCRRSSMTAASAAVFAVFWVLLSSGMTLAAPAVLLVVAMGVFAVAEAYLAPTLPAMSNDLATDRLRGRYNAVFNMSGQVGMIAGPALTGWMLAAGPPGILLSTFTVLCLLVCLIAVAARRQYLPRTVDRPTAIYQGDSHAAL